MPTVHIDKAVYEALKGIAAEQSKPFTSPNNVLRFVLNIDTDLAAGRTKKATRQAGQSAIGSQ